MSKAKALINSFPAELRPWAQCLVGRGVANGGHLGLVPDGLKHLRSWSWSNCVKLIVVPGQLR